MIDHEAILHPTTDNITQTRLSANQRFTDALAASGRARAAVRVGAVEQTVSEFRLDEYRTASGQGDAAT